MSLLNEAGDILCRNGLKDQRAPENEVISIAGNAAVPRPFWLSTNNLPDHRFHLPLATSAPDTRSLCSSAWPVHIYM